MIIKADDYDHFNCKNDIIKTYMDDIEINTEYINLGQFLKMVALVSSGGEAKSFLRENEVLINSEADDRRGRKLYKGDLVEVLGKKYRIC